MANESNSSVVRVHKNTDFTIMSNHHLRNQKLSLKAIGLMSKILGLPCDWNYSIAGLVKICKEGETAVRAALHELPLPGSRTVHCPLLSMGTASTLQK